MNPSLAPADWRPRSIDYLSLGFTDADSVQSDRRHAAGSVGQDFTMALQALISLVVLGLVIARAVNVFA